MARIPLRLVRLGEVLKRRVPEHSVEEIIGVRAGMLKRGYVKLRRNMSEYGEVEISALYEIGVRHLPIGRDAACVDLEELGFYDEVMGDP